MFELFSGKGAVSGVFKRAGVATISFDMELDPGQKQWIFFQKLGLRSNLKYENLENIIDE